MEAELQAARGRLRGVRHRTTTDDGTVGSFIKDRPRAACPVRPRVEQGFAQLDRFGLSFDASIYYTRKFAS